MATPQPGPREKRLRYAPANCPYKPVIGELENRQTARFL
jgi:hypothetical protein